MKCANCNRTVTKKSKFCPDCGSPVGQRRTQPAKKASRKLTAAQGAVLVGVGIFLGVMILKLSEGTPTSGTSSSAALQAGLQSPAVLEIAGEFDCFCGSCDDRLDVCTCEHDNGALEVKGFILQKLQEGHHKPHIIEMVKETYGSGAMNFPVPPALN